MQTPPDALGVQAAAAPQQHSSWGPPVAQFNAPPPNAAQQGKSGDWGSQPEAFAASQAPKGVGAPGQGFEGSAFGQPAAFTAGRAHRPGIACCLWVVAEEFRGQPAAWCVLPPWVSSGREQHCLRHRRWRDSPVYSTRPGSLLVEAVYGLAAGCEERGWPLVS